MGDVVGVDLRRHPQNICKVAILSLKAGLTNSVVLWWKALQTDVLVLVFRGAVLGSVGIQAVAAPVLLVDKVIEILI